MRAQDRGARRRALKASARAETRYVRDLRAVMAGIHDAYLKAIDTPAATAARRDGLTKHALRMGQLDVRLSEHVKTHVGAAYDRMAAVVNKANAKASKVLGITPAGAGVQSVIAAARDANIQLVEKAARTYAQQVRDVFDDPANVGARVEDLAADLRKRASVSESRAELIARDQTLKLNGALNKARQTSAGVTSYTWSTSHDERVRPDHAELDGQVFRWDDPPETNEDGDRNHPGEDFQCRCVPIPVIDELEGVFS